MSDGKYTLWTVEEEDNLQEWMSHHQHLPWKKKREEYFRQTGKWRSISSLRSKLEQLDQGIRRRRPLYEEVVQPAYAQKLPLQRSLLENLPLSPPPLILKTPDPVARRILEQWRQAEIRLRWDFSISAPTEQLVDYNTLSHITAIPKKVTVASDWVQKIASRGLIQGGIA
ncbi:hypothetical protein PMG11_11366 [Penicillium brasilianum]|uniref:Uncharacterized protein n=1 Tax=Penicillium brasilianum TaxID=104259 RepID=A0A0F7U3L6_PENBI|nr:hypothetical protein PMG11_11366 [Penicillium brasilianum]